LGADVLSRQRGIHHTTSGERRTKLIELHILQTVAPSNLNRDDTNSPKDALFGGFRRARVSSQAQKRAVRTAFAQWGSISKLDRGVRTRRLVEEIVRRLAGRRDPELATRATEAALASLGLGVKEGRTEYLVFLGQRELDRLASLVDQYFDKLAAAAVSGKGKVQIDKTEKEALRKALDGGQAVDIALFGRMLADAPELTIDAACQVAHALSTHKVDREFDFYTAVDDLNPREETGAGMMGDVEFYSATLYRYAVLDVAKLVENLQDDRDLAVQAARAFAEAFALALPSGKLNTFAAHNPPLLVAFRGGDGLPRNLATAFEQPVRPRDDAPLSALSIQRLAQEWAKFDRAFGPLQGERKAHLTLVDANGATEPLGEAVASLPELLERIVDTARQLVA